MFFLPLNENFSFYVEDYIKIFEMYILLQLKLIEENYTEDLFCTHFQYGLETYKMGRRNKSSVQVCEIIVLRKLMEVSRKAGDELRSSAKKFGRY